MLSAKALPAEGHTALAAFKADVDLGDHLFVHGRVISSRRGELSVMAEPVLREGAETMLFYVPIVAAAGDKVHYVWIGLAVGLVALVVIYLLIQFAAVRIPLRPFFTITSLLMAFMAFTFTGSGIAELQEADVVSLTPISGFPTIDLLGIYPRVENLAAQAIVLAIIVGLYFFGKARLAREAAAQSRAEE